MPNTTSTPITNQIGQSRLISNSFARILIPFALLAALLDQYIPSAKRLLPGTPLPPMSTQYSAPAAHQSLARLASVSTNGGKYLLSLCQTRQQSPLPSCPCVLIAAGSSFELDQTKP